ncbi:hypothetical protein CVU83_00850 [Candidatus Falkowbacteria bacterium HGW-Falkowbacteria-2]|uniref:PKD domain-containing protein n=1 Tax=Candidatus Falkowbacteria bacterium HGW-Falkowbacteria-2 TaxID=2013769 RepID=A0A2N2E2R2_9BACT|nr:MAG: hypothetical protein CVU83_00850 [Candidatus Falkowbacteria bacterium HGW-Falkowbacteria-2]
MKENEELKEMRNRLRLQMAYKMLFVALAFVLVSCLKDYDDDPEPIVPDTEFVLKVAGATMVGDTFNVAPNVYAKAFVDNLPLPVSSYLFNWTLGNNQTSTIASPEFKHVPGLYQLSVVITPLAGGEAVYRSAWLRVGTQVSPDEAIILIHASPSGSNYVYQIGMNVEYITGYTPITSSNPGFIAGDFTGSNWPQVPITQTQVIGNKTYMVYSLTLPANSQVKQYFGYGQAGQWGYAPNSIYWVTTSTGGVFGAYFNNGTMSVTLGGPMGYPGDGGDEEVGGLPPVVRNKLIYALNTGVSDTLVLWVNYGAYANGPYPFISRLTTGSPVNEALVIDPLYPGWAYIKYPIGTITQFLRWRFGANLYTPTSFGDMSNSKYFNPDDNLLEIQLIVLDNAKRYEVRIATTQQISNL